MQVTWLVVADAGRARIFEHQNQHHRLVELETFVDPLAHARGADLQDDKPGQFAGAPGSVSSTASARTDKHQVHAAQFAQSLAHHLHNAHASGQFQRLELAAEPHFLGLLRREIKPDCRVTIERQWNRDWIHLPPAELASRVQIHH